MIKYIEFGRVASIHGLKGEVLLDCFFKNANHFFETGVFEKEGEEFRQIAVRPTGTKKDGIIIKIDGFDSKDSAYKLLKKELFIPRAELDKFDDGTTETHFVADLLGLEVFVDGEKESFGTVVDVVDFGGGPLLEVKFTSSCEKRLEYYEKNSKIIKEVNLTKKRIILNKEL